MCAGRVSATPSDNPDKLLVVTLSSRMRRKALFLNREYDAATAIDGSLFHEDYEFGRREYARVLSDLLQQALILQLIEVMIVTIYRKDNLNML